jgi:3-hydroxyacyl-CoA dehydrogenase
LDGIVRYERRQGLGLINIDNPPVNALSDEVRGGLMAALDIAAGDARAAAVVIACAGRTFIAGADIREFERPARILTGEVVSRIENMPKIVVAAIHGTALGGGLEIALGCHYRCAVASARVGLPEVLLGLLPGATGTQRLPRLVGVEEALDMMISGKSVGAAEALEKGLVDEIVEGDLPEEAISYAQRLATSGAPIRRIRDLEVNCADLPAGFFDDYRKRIAPRTRGYFAPERIIRCVEAAVSLPLAEGHRLERKLFEECRNSSQSIALRRLFFAEREVARIPGVPKDTPQRPIARVGIVGAGTMGGDIALCFASAGIPVDLLEASPEGLERGLATVRCNYETAATEGRISAAEFEQLISLIHGTLDFDRLSRADLVVEAVSEEFALKEEVFAKLDAVCKPGTVFATSTSTLDLDRIARATRRPADVVGLHFFSPASVTRLVEVVRGAETAPAVIATAMGVAKTLEKIGVLVGNCRGFVGNRMFGEMMRENQMMQLEGVLPERIDRVTEKWGMAMGPNAMLDLAGIDNDVKGRQARPDKLEDPTWCRISDLLFEHGRFGQKTGRGFYRYEQGSRVPIPDPELHELIRAEAKRFGIAPREIGDAEIIERMFYTTINEGTLILEEGNALRSGDIDVIWVNGYGFPRYRGGPMCYGEMVGLREVLGAVKRYRDRYGDRYWRPAPLLERLAGSPDGSFGPNLGLATQSRLSRTDR